MTKKRTVLLPEPIEDEALHLLEAVDEVAFHVAALGLALGHLVLERLHPGLALLRQAGLERGLLVAIHLDALVQAVAARGDPARRAAAARREF